MAEVDQICSEPGVSKGFSFTAAALWGHALWTWRRPWPTLSRTTPLHRRESAGSSCRRGACESRRVRAFDHRLCIRSAGEGARSSRRPCPARGAAPGCLTPDTRNPPVAGKHSGVSRYSNLYMRGAYALSVASRVRAAPVARPISRHPVGRPSATAGASTYRALPCRLGLRSPKPSAPEVELFPVAAVRGSATADT